MALSSWIIIANEAKSSTRKEELLKLLIDSINWINVIHFVDGCARKKRKRKYIVLYSFSDDHWLEIKMIYQTFTFTTLFSLFDAKRLARLRDLCRFCSDWDLLCFYIRSFQRIPQFLATYLKKWKKNHEYFEHFAHCSKNQPFVQN